LIGRSSAANFHFFTLWPFGLSEFDGKSRFTSSENRTVKACHRCICLSIPALFLLSSPVAFLPAAAFALNDFFLPRRHLHSIVILHPNLFLFWRTRLAIVRLLFSATLCAISSLHCARISSSFCRTCLAVFPQFSLQYHV
jgi:hypothetical protein